MVKPSAQPLPPLCRRGESEELSQKYCEFASTLEKSMAFCCTIPQSRLRRASSLYTREPLLNL